MGAAAPTIYYIHPPMATSVFTRGGVSDQSENLNYPPDFIVMSVINAWVMATLTGIAQIN